MNFKRKSPKRTNWRKEVGEGTSIKEWSRMLHKGWKQDVVDKIQFKRTNSTNW